MPELPEVETIRRTLNALIAGKTVARVTVRLPRILQRPDDPAAFSAMLEGRTFQRVERRGKFLLMMLDGLTLVSHLRMEGRYGVFPSDEPLAPHTHVVFHLSDGTDLRYRDVRQFGTMHLFQSGEEWLSEPLNKLGIEPLTDEFTVEAFERALGRRSGKIKPLLLNQEIIAGLGNIYADEALHLAGIHPLRSAASLKKAERQRLYGAIAATLRAAVEAGGTSVRSYVNGRGEMGMFQHRLHVYGRTGEPCHTCGSPIVRLVVGGRGTHVCPQCQRAPRGAPKTAATGSGRKTANAVKRRLDGE